MKSFICAMIIAALMTCGGIAFNIGIRSISDSFTAGCDKINAAAANGDFDAALEEISGLSDAVKKRKTVLAAVINHENIDEIEVCISELSGYVENGDRTETAVHCLRLRHLLEHLPENYSVTAQNIL